MSRKVVSTLAAFLTNEVDPTAVEYAVMLAPIIVVCITAITTLGSNTDNTLLLCAHPGWQDRLMRQSERTIGNDWDPVSLYSRRG